MWQQLTVEAEQAKVALAAQLQTLQAAAMQMSPKLTLKVAAKAEAAAIEIYIDEALTRDLIDEQLREHTLVHLIKECSDAVADCTRSE